MTDNLLSMELAANRSGVSISTIQRYVAMGQLSVAQRGKYRRVYLDPAIVEEWAIWYRKCRQERTESRRKGIPPLARVNGMIVQGQLSCEKKDGSDRDRLFALVRGVNKKCAKEALIELYQKYRLRLPLKELELGICLGR